MFSFLPVFSYPDHLAPPRLHAHFSRLWSAPGMSHGEEWRFLHVAPSLVVLYYCGQGNTWQYEGGLVLSRERSSPPDHVSLAAEVRACFLSWGGGACRGVC